MSENRSSGAPLRRGDMVMVIGIDDDAKKFWPGPGAIGTVATVCVCQFLNDMTEAYRVNFSGSRTGCYKRPQLKKLEPPNEPETVEQEREVPA